MPPTIPFGKSTGWTGRQRPQGDSSGSERADGVAVNATGAHAASTISKVNGASGESRWEVSLPAKDYGLVMCPRRLMAMTSRGARHQERSTARGFVAGPAISSYPEPRSKWPSCLRVRFRAHGGHRSPALTSGGPQAVMTHPQARSLSPMRLRHSGQFVGPVHRPSSRL